MLHFMHFTVMACAPSLHAGHCDRYRHVYIGKYIHVSIFRYMHVYTCTALKIYVFYSTTLLTLYKHSITDVLEVAQVACCLWMLATCETDHRLSCMQMFIYFLITYMFAGYAVHSLTITFNKIWINHNKNDDRNKASRFCPKIELWLFFGEESCSYI